MNEVKLIIDLRYAEMYCNTAKKLWNDKIFKKYNTIFIIFSKAKHGNKETNHQNRNLFKNEMNSFLACLILSKLFRVYFLD